MKLLDKIKNLFQKVDEERNIPLSKKKVLKKGAPGKGDQSRFKKKEGSLLDIADTPENHAKIIEILNQDNVSEKLIKAFEFFPETRKWSHANISALIGKKTDRSSVTRHLGYAYKIGILLGWINKKEGNHGI